MRPARQPAGRAIDQAGSSEALRAKLESDEARDVVIDLIASENQIPRFVAVRVYEGPRQRWLAAASAGRASPAPSP